MRDRERMREQGQMKATYEFDWTSPERVDSRELVTFICEQYAAGKQRRLPWEKEAARRLEWLRGNQHIFNEDDQQEIINGRLMPRTARSEEEVELFERFPMKVNMLKRFCMSWVGLLFSKPVGWQVLPQTNDLDDLQAAKLCTQLLQYYWSSGVTHGMERLLEAMWHMWGVGIIFLHPMWDPQKHYAEHFSDATDQDNLPRGDLVYDFATGFDLTEPEGCPSIYLAEWIIDSRLRSIEWGMAHYGRKFKDIEPDSRNADHHLEAYHMARRTVGDVGVDSASGIAPDDQVLVHTFWRPKSANAPQGFYAIVANDKLIVKGVHPYAHGRLPYVPLQEQPDFENFRPGCSCNDEMDLQYARNHDRSQRQAHLARAINPTIVKEHNVQVSDGAFKWKGPHIVNLSGAADALAAGRIQPWPPPALPSDAFVLDDVNKRDMEDIAGIHRSTMGRSEGSSQSGRHADLMARGDMRASTVSRILLEKALSKAGQQALWLLHEFVEVKRVIPIVGTSKQRAVRAFKGSDLFVAEKKYVPFGPYEFNVQVSVVPERDMAVVLAEIDLLIERGIFNPQDPVDRMRILKLLGDEFVGGEMADPTEPHRQKARIENDDLLVKEVGPLSADLDDVHVFEHELFMVGEDFRQRYEADPSVEGRFARHIKAHRTKAARKVLEAQFVAVEAKLELEREYPNVANFLRSQQQVQQAGGAAPGNGAAIRRPGLAIRE